ncbi:hypothetical protein, partial [Xenorhabdus doucetiae]|uniref:hypothetical protein n=1 Tax=Xenorhabdus doucetiae TaxID=351671 RepID=UPI001478732B
PRCLRASQGAACRLYAARTRRTAARRPASRTTFARCRKGNASQNQAVESTRASTGAILHPGKQNSLKAHIGDRAKKSLPQRVKPAL